MERHREFLVSTASLVPRRQKQRKEEFAQTVKQKIGERFLALMQNEERLVAIAEEVEKGSLDPYSASVEILKDQTLLGRLATS